MHPLAERFIKMKRFRFWIIIKSGTSEIHARNQNEVLGNDRIISIADKTHENIFFIYCPLEKISGRESLCFAAAVGIVHKRKCRVKCCGFSRACRAGNKNKSSGFERLSLVVFKNFVRHAHIPEF